MKNLKLFKNYDIYGKTAEVMDHIDFIEELINLKRFDYVPLEARKVLEILLVDDFMTRTLNSAIRKFAGANNIPLTIEKSLMFIKEKGNEAAHSLSLFEKNYGLESDAHSAIEIQKNLFIVLRYFVELTSNFSIDISTIKFSDVQIGEKSKFIKKKSIVINNGPRVTGVKTKSGTDMDKMKSLVRMVGMSSFINYFMEWDNFDKYSEKLIRDTGVSIASAKIKASGSKSIVKQGYTKIALEFISNSTRVDNSVSKKAEKILSDYNF